MFAVSLKEIFAKSSSTQKPSHSIKNSAQPDPRTPGQVSSCCMWHQCRTLMCSGARERKSGAGCSVADTLAEAICKHYVFKFSHTVHYKACAITSTGSAVCFANASYELKEIFSTVKEHVESLFSFLVKCTSTFYLPASSYFLPPNHSPSCSLLPL